MPTPDQFESYFQKTADKAEELFACGFRTEAFLVATVAIDALAQLWRHDFKLTGEDGPLNFAAFVDQFAGDPRSRLVCVVFLAEDMLTHSTTRLHPAAQRLLEARAAWAGPKPREVHSRECPHAHRDASWADLIVEEPSLAGETSLQSVARYYTRAALAYRLYRCGPAHAFSRGSRTSGFSDIKGDDEISYFPPYRSGGFVRPISLKIGIRTFTGWLRSAATNYAAECIASEKTPGFGFDASATSLANLTKKWKSVT